MHSNTVPVLVLAVARTNYAKGEPSSFRLAYSIYHTLRFREKHSLDATPDTAGCLFAATASDGNTLTP